MSAAPGDDLNRLRQSFLDRLDARPFTDWSPELLRALIAVFDLHAASLQSSAPGYGLARTPAGFRPHLVK